MKQGSSLVGEALDEAAWGRVLDSQLMPPHPDALPPAAVAAAALETGTEWGSHVFGEHRRCERASALRREGIVRVGRIYDRADYFGIGSLVHAALSYVWDGMREGDLGRDPIDALRAATQREGGIVIDTYEEALRLVTAYFAHYGIPDWNPEHTKVIAVERLLSDGTVCACPGLGSSYHDPQCPNETASFAMPYTARLDLILEIAGEITLVDTKTRAKGMPRDREEYARDLRTREQFLGQAHLAMREFGLATPPAIVVNAIVKTKVPGFDRLRVTPSLDDVERWRENHAREAARGLRSSDDAIMNYSACAPEIGSKCDFIKYCHGNDHDRAGFARKESGL